MRDPVQRDLEELLARAQAAAVIALELRHALVVAAQGEGVTLVRAGRAMGVTPSAVRYIRDHPPSRPGPPAGSEWTAEHRANFDAAIDGRWQTSSLG